MATLTALGVRLDLDGPRPVAPPHSLLNTPGVVVEDNGRWMNGVVLDPYPDDVPVVWDPCSAGTYRTKNDGANKELPTFDAFVFYIPVTCSYFSSNGLREMAQAALDAKQSYGVELGLAAGVPGMTNPFLSDAAMTVLGSGAVGAAEALARLENAIGATGGQGIIHATPAVVSAWTADKLEGDEEGNLVTANGTRVVSGDGYIDIKPVNEVAPADGEDWVYATGPVEVRLGPAQIQDVRTSLDRSDNTITFRAERSVLAEWDLTLQVGILVDWTS